LIQFSLDVTTLLMYTLYTCVLLFFLSSFVETVRIQILKMVLSQWHILCIIIRFQPIFKYFHWILVGVQSNTSNRQQTILFAIPIRYTIYLYPIRLVDRQKKKYYQLNVNIRNEYFSKSSTRGFHNIWMFVIYM
jgi:hypothetical protein